MSKLLVETDARGVATLTLNRPEVHNAFDDGLIAELTQVFERLAADRSVRVLVLTGAGASFSAGADLNWMRRMGGFSAAENLADAMALAAMLRRLNDFPKPTVARINGAAFAGGVGLISCCDIAIAAADAVFAVSEVRFGLVPGTIGPYLVAAVGPRAARRLFQTAERISAEEARRVGLVHETVPRAELDTLVEKFVALLLDGGAEAQAVSKRLAIDLANRDVDDAVMQETAKASADARAGAEGREGTAAFLEKRKPKWRK
ncbi:MAG TPA: enoyl-CoA hydratase-related protein [Stellaceae bacterium]|jgi:methylglutaconyl-CoA hydratase|nr:enoyl-CoA hydratase-related protein [Stellaceae bacterium]